MKQNEVTGGTCRKGAKGTVLTDPTKNLGVKEIIMSLVAIVRIETEERRRSLDVTDEQLVEKVLARIEEERRVFSDANESRKYYGTVTREVVWNYVNVTESERIINRLKSGDQLFAQKFFYGTNHNGCNISRFRSRIIAQIKQTYHYDVSVEEFGNIVYAHLWAGGTWSVLDNYARKSSFFCWLEQVARHEVMRVLEEMRIINVDRERTVSNTRLLGTSVSPEVWDCIISDLMPAGLNRDLLMASLVDRKSEKSMMLEFGMNAETLGDAVKKAEAVLKDKLIRSDSYYEELVLRDKSPRNIEVSAEFIKDFVKWQEEKNDANLLADMLGVNLNKAELEEKVVEFLYRFSDKLQWSDEDRLIWRLRFIEDTPPAEVAERCGKDRAWLDTRYSRLNKKFNVAIKEWWRKNSK